MYHALFLEWHLDSSENPHLYITLMLLIWLKNAQIFN